MKICNTLQIKLSLLLLLMLLCYVIFICFIFDLVQTAFFGSIFILIGTFLIIKFFSIIANKIAIREIKRNFKNFKIDKNNINWLLFPLFINDYCKYLNTKIKDQKKKNLLGGIQ